MKLKLPPRLTPAQFGAALKDYETVVGTDWVMTTDQDRDAYADIYAPAPETIWSHRARSRRRRRGSRRRS